MPDNVFSSTMTLDGAPYLAASAKVSQATALSEAQLKRLDAQVMLITNALRPLAAMASLVQKQFDLVRASTTTLAAANAPATASISATAAALLGLNGEQAQLGLSRTARMLGAITMQAASAQDAIEGVGQSMEGANEDSSSAPAQTKSEAESGEEPAEKKPASHTIASTAAVAIGAHAGASEQKAQLGAIEDEEKKVETETRHVTDAVNHLSDALTHTAAATEHTAASAHKAAGDTKHAGDSIEKAGHQSEHARKEVNDLAHGFEGLGEGARKVAEILRDVLVAMPEVAGLVGILAGVGEAVSKIREAFTYGDQLNALSRQTGESATTIAQLRRTFDYFDVSADEVGHTLFMLQKSLGGVSEEGEPTAQAFGRIGLSIADLRKMDAAGQFEAIMIGLQKLPDQASRSAVAMQIFGRSAMEVQAILNADPTDFAESMQDAAEYAQIMGRNANAFEEIERKFFVFRENIETLFARIAAGLAPAVNSLLSSLDKVDFSKWGRDLTLAMNLVNQAFSQGKVGELIGLTLKLGFIDAMNALNAGFYGLAAAMTEYFTGVMPAQLEAALSAWTNPNLYKGIGELLLGAFLSIQGRISQIFVGISVLFMTLLEEAVNGLVNHPGLRTLLSALASAIPGASAAIGAFDLLKPDNRSPAEMEKDNAARVNASYQGFVGVAAAGDKMTGQGVGDIASAVVPAVSAVGSAMAKMADKAQEAAKNAPNAIDPTDTLNQYRGLLGKLYQAIPNPDSSSGTKPTLGTSSIPNYNYKIPDNDRLAKMGLFVGGSTATPGLTEARRTAAATEGSLAILKILGNRLIGPSNLSPVPRYM